MEWVEEDTGGDCSGESLLALLSAPDDRWKIAIRWSRKGRTSCYCASDANEGRYLPGFAGIEVSADSLQPVQLGIFRSDYLLHSSSPLQPPEIKQVEFNTIASSFGALSQRANEMHR